MCFPPSFQEADESLWEEPANGRRSLGSGQVPSLLRSSERARGVGCGKTVVGGYGKTWLGVVKPGWLR